MSYLEKRANRLINEDSPYLLQHAYNPIDWYAWGEEAFLKARVENKPIFVSIGYSTCHWCHVMEREVFENVELARLLNELFVSIKVDREERPDIDKHFQHIHYIITRRSGGWPTSIFLTPDKKPFFAATYLPPKPKHGMMGFGEVVKMLFEKLQDAPQEVYAVASNIERAAKTQNRRFASSLDFDLLPLLKGQVQKSFDKEDGGILGEPKFPHAALLALLLDSGDQELIGTALFTLRCMARGGMYDIVEGGFCRYSVDSFWLVPHFEKMAYDNGLLIEVYTKAYGVSKEPFFLRIARECADFMMNKMSEEGLFYSASDADSEGEEGRYFVYSYEEALSALEDGGMADARVILKTLGFSKNGNFEGKNIARNESFEDSKELQKALEILRELRRQRAYPFIDKKVICSWNAMVVTGMLELSRYDPSYLEPSINSLSALERKLIRGDTLFRCAVKEPKIEAFFEDCAFLAKAYVRAYLLSGSEVYLQKAKRLCDRAIWKFYRGGVWMLSVGEFETEADPSDSSYSSPIGVICETLLYFGEEYREVISDTLRMYAKEIETYPIYYASLGLPLLCKSSFD